MKRKFDLSKMHASIERFLRMKPRAHGAEDIEVMENRIALLDALYAMDGRDKKDHPQHGLYTGLFEQYIKN
jgi:hypothetical protein